MENIRRLLHIDYFKPHIPKGDTLGFLGGKNGMAHPHHAPSTSGPFPGPFPRLHRSRSGSWGFRVSIQW